MADWSKAVKKGALGEFIVDALLSKKNIVPYHPVFDGPHPFDRLCASLDKKRLYIIEVKTKARRTHYPDTGINIRHYNEYKYVRDHYNIPVFLVFVDEGERRIYGNFLTKLEKPKAVATERWHAPIVNYPLEENGIIYFPLNSMIDIAKLDEREAEKLKELSARSYLYKTVQG